MTYRPRSPRTRQRARAKAFAYRETIADLYLHGNDDGAIAEATGLTTPEVTRERENMGLAVAATAGIKWLPEADKMITAMRMRGCFWETIASALPGFEKPPAGITVRYRFEYLQRLGLRRIQNGKKKERLCITCDAPFPSEGAHNRMCDPCREDAGSDSHCVVSGSGQRRAARGGS